ncbi:hypothetical protein CIT31_18790 [Mesorhizobium wenxiniae]|uniref:Uncharacterized protein n=1 Tax=Mesorhizobium wenxiniae TaxID=2014805 RepID=A0A271KF74_9HYPH|nr:hypothetical protein CIT31_18790 [Mesorhizobium wenxiniae]
MVLLSFATLLVVDLVQSWSPNATADVTGVSSAGSDTAGQRTAGRALPAADGSRVRLPGGLSGIVRLRRGGHVRRSAKHGSCAADTPTSKPPPFCSTWAHTPRLSLCLVQIAAWPIRVANLFRPPNGSGRAWKQASGNRLGRLYSHLLIYWSL